MNDRKSVDVALIIENQRLTKFLIQLVVLSWIVTFFDGFDMIGISYVASAIRQEFALDKAMVGNLFSIGLVGTMIGGFLFGWLGDRIGRRPTIILATASFGLLTLALALADGYRALLMLRLLDGIALGGMVPVSWALNIEYAPQRYRATIVTVIMVGYSLGAAAGGPVANWLVPGHGWRSFFVFGGALSLAAAAMLWAGLPESARFLASKGRRPDRIAQLLRRVAPTSAFEKTARFVLSDETAAAGADAFADRPRWLAPMLRLGQILRALFQDELKWITPLLWLAYIFSSMAVFFLANWIPMVFEALGYSWSQATWAATVNTLAGAAGGLLLMRFTDQRGAIAISVMPLVAVPLVLLAGLVDLGYWGFLATAALIYFFIIGGHFGLHSIAGIFYPSAYRGNGTGWAISVAKIGAIAGPWIAGQLLNTGLPVRHIFLVLAICPAVFVVAIAIIGAIQRRLLRRERAATAEPDPGRGRVTSRYASAKAK